MPFPTLGTLRTSRYIGNGDLFCDDGIISVNPPSQFPSDLPTPAPSPFSSDSHTPAAYSSSFSHTSFFTPPPPPSSVPPSPSSLNVWYSKVLDAFSECGRRLCAHLEREAREKEGGEEEEEGGSSVVLVVSPFLRTTHTSFPHRRVLQDLFRCRFLS